MNILKNVKNNIQNRLNEVVLLNKLSNDTFTLRLPLFLLTGDEINISLRVKGKDLLITNGMYKNIEKQLIECTSSKNILKDYLLNDKKFQSSIEENLKIHDITHSLNLKKIIKDFKEVNIETLTTIILQYSFAMVQHYGYIYHYALIYARESSRSESFKTAMSNFINNVKSTYEIEEYQNDNIVHNQHDYYKADNKVIFSAVRGKNALHEVLEDISDLKNDGEIEKGIILLDYTKNKELNTSYLEKMKKRFRKRNISYVIIKNENFKEFEETLKELRK